MREDVYKKLALYLIFVIIGICFVAVFESMWGTRVSFEREKIPMFMFTPGLYCAWSIISSYYFIRYFIHKQPGGVSLLSLDRFIREYDITPRELEVVKHLINGLSNNDICDELSIGMATVKTHLNNLFQKTGARSRTELVSIIIQEK